MKFKVGNQVKVKTEIDRRSYGYYYGSIMYNCGDDYSNYSEYYMVNLPGIGEYVKHESEIILRY